MKIKISQAASVEDLAWMESVFAECARRGELEVNCKPSSSTGRTLWVERTRAPSSWPREVAVRYVCGGTLYVATDPHADKPVTVDLTKMGDLSHAKALAIACEIRNAWWSA